ncbi:TIGR03943 family protein [Hazenella sp. IB182353]|uniref:TIGR03943 family putative permease subunit n=1 Tax=Polycladospora coralii TaxID=2771432 RepID=UPI001746E2BB|nr:TIGR03943 family protein [Polycladospora coralii]MBS7531673.1 TIGR03943 family protein [Polycladospora coralii]
MASIARLLICLGLSTLFIQLIVSDELSLFINPKYNWLIFCCVLILIILSIVQLYTLKKPDIHFIGKWGYVMMTLPLVMVIIFPPQALDPSMASKKGTFYLPQGNQQKNTDSVNDNYPVDQEVDTQINEATTDSSNDDFTNPYQKIKEEMLKKDLIQFTEENYADYYNALSFYPTEFVGKKIKILGFVYHDQTLKKDEFVIGRFTVTCCTADAMVIGVVVKDPHAIQLKNKKWIEVTGTLTTTKQEGYDMPAIQLTSSEDTTEPKDPYIYFY